MYLGMITNGCIRRSHIEQEERKFLVRELLLSTFLRDDGHGLFLACFAYTSDRLTDSGMIRDGMSRLYE